MNSISSSFIVTLPCIAPSCLTQESTKEYWMWQSFSTDESEGELLRGPQAKHTFLSFSAVSSNSNTTWLAFTESSDTFLWNKVPVSDLTETKSHEYRVKKYVVFNLFQFKWMWEIYLNWFFTWLQIDKHNREGKCRKERWRKKKGRKNKILVNKNLLPR